MKKTAIALFVVSLLIMSGTAFATEEVKEVETTTIAPQKATEATPQQSRMKICAGEYHAKKLEKSQYRAFISKCMKGEAFDPSQKADKPSAQQIKIKTCKAEAKTQKLKGAAKKTFMKGCLTK